MTFQVPRLAADGQTVECESTGATGVDGGSGGGKSKTVSVVAVEFLLDQQRGFVSPAALQAFQVSTCTYKKNWRETWGKIRFRPVGPAHLGAILKIALPPSPGVPARIFRSPIRPPAILVKKKEKKKNVRKCLRLYTHTHTQVGIPETYSRAQMRELCAFPRVKKKNTNKWER